MKTVTSAPVNPDSLPEVARVKAFLYCHFDSRGGSMAILAESQEAADAVYLPSLVPEDETPESYNMSPQEFEEMKAGILEEDREGEVEFVFYGKKPPQPGPMDEAPDLLQGEDDDYVEVVLVEGGDGMIGRDDVPGPIKQVFMIAVEGDVGDKLRDERLNGPEGEESVVEATLAELGIQVPAGLSIDPNVHLGEDAFGLLWVKA